MARKHPTHPHPGRSYTASSGAFVRVDYVKPDGDVLAVIWPTWWTSKESCECIRYTREDFAALLERQDLQPVTHAGEVGGHG